MAVAFFHPVVSLLMLIAAVTALPALDRARAVQESTQSKQCKESPEPFQYLALCEPSSNVATPSCFEGHMLSPTPCEDGNPMCLSCPQNYFQPFNNNCSVCYPCTQCADGQKVGQECTPENDTVCIPLTPSSPAVVGPSLPITPGTPTGPQILSTTTPATKTLETSPSLPDPSLGRTGNVTSNTTEPSLKVVPENLSNNGDKIAIWTISAVALIIITGLVLVIIYLLQRLKRTGNPDENKNVPHCMELNELLPRDRRDPPEERYAAVGDDLLQNGQAPRASGGERATGGESSNHRQRVDQDRSEATNSEQEDCEGPSHPIYATVNKDGKQVKQPPGASGVTFNGSSPSGSSSGSPPAEISSETHQDTHGKRPHRRNPQHYVKGNRKASSPQGENEPLLKRPKDEGNTGHKCNSSSGPSDGKSNDETSVTGKGTDIESREDNSSESGSESNGLSGEGASSEEVAGARTENRLPDLSDHQNTSNDDLSPAGANPAYSNISTLDKHHNPTTDLEENSFGAKNDHCNSTPAADASTSNQPTAKQALPPDPSNPVTDDNNSSCLENVDEKEAMQKGVTNEDFVQPDDDKVDMEFLQELSDEITFLEAKRICRLCKLPEVIIDGIEHDKPYDDRNIELFKKALKILGKDLTYHKVLRHLSVRNKHVADKLIEQFHIQYSSMLTA